jgi:hypothetical protein
MVLVRACSFTVSTSARSGLASTMLAGQRYGTVTAQAAVASPVSDPKTAITPPPKPDTDPPVPAGRKVVADLVTTTT